MAQNSLAPGYVVLHYAVTFGTQIRTHKMTLPVLPDGPFAPGNSPDFILNDGTPQTFQTCVDDLLEDAKGFFSPLTSFLLAEYWQKETPSDDPLFIKSVIPGVTVGTGAAAVSAGQATISFRTSNGGIFKFTMMESEVAVTTVDLYPFPVGDAQAVSTFLTGAAGWVRGRDGGELAQAIKLVGKTNDHLRKKYILTS